MHIVHIKIPGIAFKKKSEKSILPDFKSNNEEKLEYSNR